MWTSNLKGQVVLSGYWPSWIKRLPGDKRYGYALDYSKMSRTLTVMTTRLPGYKQLLLKVHLSMKRLES